MVLLLNMYFEDKKHFTLIFIHILIIVCIGKDGGGESSGSSTAIASTMAVATTSAPATSTTDPMQATRRSTRTRAIKGNQVIVFI